MNNEIRWFARLGVDQGHFSRRDCLLLQKSLGDQADLMDFAQRLIDDGIVETVETLEQIAALSLSKAKEGPPADDPFEEKTAEAQAPAAAPIGNISLRSPGASAPAVDLTALAALSDQALATAMGDLLRESARFGASDLHLSAGAKPFLRKHRALVTLSDTALSPELSMRMNTALLAPHQRQTYSERRDFDYALA